MASGAAYKARSSSRRALPRRFILRTHIRTRRWNTLRVSRSVISSRDMAELHGYTGMSPVVIVCMCRSLRGLSGILVFSLCMPAIAADDDDLGYLDMRLLVASVSGSQVVRDVDQGLHSETDPDPGWRAQLQYIGQISGNSPWRWGLGIGTQQMGTEDVFDLEGKIRWYMVQGRVGLEWRATPWLSFECLPFVGYGRASIITGDGSRRSDSAWEYGVALTGVIDLGPSWICGIEAGPLITETYQVYDDDTEYRISGRTFTLGMFIGATL